MSRSFILVPIDFSYTTSYRLSNLNSNFCSRTHRLATIHNVTARQHTQHCTKYGRLIILFMSWIIQILYITYSCGFPIRVYYIFIFIHQNGISNKQNKNLTNLTKLLRNNPQFMLICSSNSSIVDCGNLLWKAVKVCSVVNCTMYFNKAIR